MAEKVVQASSTHLALAEFAEKKNPRPVTAGHEQPPASVETKPSPEIAAISKEHYNQGTAISNSALSGRSGRV